MILGGRDRGRQMIKAELDQPGQETLLLLAAEHPEYEFGGIRCAAPGDDGENEAGEKRMVEVGDAAPFRPLRFARLLLSSHFHPVCWARYRPRASFHVKFMVPNSNDRALTAL